MRELLVLKGHSSKRKDRTIRLASINVGTLAGRSRELVKTLKKRRVDIACVQKRSGRGQKRAILAMAISSYIMAMQLDAMESSATATVTSSQTFNGSPIVSCLSRSPEEAMC
ncbi:hypothetical protein Y032_0021g333 [Ancylostoma ceylanicum]|uniref:Endonuclease/exonuclease/phosphatase domain-containing protein n=1 Tax=Ancylostoma ceylanicum TaxID=53326 RepID=A0A016V072_9BILA|nr:hypothetical protein Y032_0021g333 [Ancylostoma ceylanicum]